MRERLLGLAVTGLAAAGLFVAAAPANAAGNHLECNDSGGLRINCALDAGIAEALTGELWYENGSHLTSFDGQSSISTPCVNHQTWTISVSYLDSAGVAQNQSMSRVCTSAIR